MFDEQMPAHGQTPPKDSSNEWNADCAALGGDAFLSDMINSVSAGDMEQREWARAVADNEDIVAGFVAKTRQALRAVREARGLSMEMAAEQAGVSTSALSRLESGGSGKIDLKLMARVALMLDVVPRLDFAVKGAAATVSVGDMETIRANLAGLRRLDQPSDKSSLGFSGRWRGRGQRWECRRFRIRCLRAGSGDSGSEDQGSGGAHGRHGAWRATGQGQGLTAAASGDGC